jgi:hypothetical protein
MRVVNVITLDTLRDITKWLNACAEEYEFDAVGFLGGAISESNLRELAARERVWPDVSYGLWQPAVKWLGPEATGLTREANGTVIDTPENRVRASALCWDAAWLSQYVAPRYARLLETWGTPLEAWCRWNKPNITGIENPNRANYVRGLAEAQEYAMSQGDGVDASNPIKEKMKLVGDYPIMAAEFVRVSSDPTAPQAEKVHGTKGYYISSPADGWVLHGPFGQAE